jgi:hypothetical protein
MSERDPDAIGERPRPFRPALVTLSDDVRDRVDELQSGLSSEDRVLEWVQELTIRTLGNLDPLVYADLARQYRGPQGVLLAAFLQPGARRGRMNGLGEETAQAVRERFLAKFVYPAHRQAFRELRTDATEYVDDAGDGDAHEPHRQTFIAMRPALSELEQWQERALSRLLDGFDERGDILDWAPDLVLATHGELEEGWVTRCYEEESAVAVLLGDSEEHARGRRLMAAHHIIPRFRDGVRVLAGRAGELADAETDEIEVPMA